MPSQQKDMAHRNPREGDTWGARSCVFTGCTVSRVPWPLLGAPITPDTHLPRSPYHMPPEAAVHHSASLLRVEPWEWGLLLFSFCTLVTSYGAWHSAGISTEYI